METVSILDLFRNRISLFPYWKQASGRLQVITLHGGYRCSETSNKSNHDLQELRKLCVARRMVSARRIWHEDYKLVAAQSARIWALLRNRRVRCYRKMSRASCGGSAVARDVSDGSLRHQYPTEASGDIRPVCTCPETHGAAQLVPARHRVYTHSWDAFSSRRGNLRPSSAQGHTGDAPVAQHIFEARRNNCSSEP